MKTPASIQTILDTASSSRRHVAGLRGDFRSRLDSFRRHRSAEEQQELTEDFRRVLVAWGIADADIPGVITTFRAIRVACMGGRRETRNNENQWRKRCRW